MKLFLVSIISLTALASAPESSYPSKSEPTLTGTWKLSSLKMDSTEFFNYKDENVVLESTFKREIATQGTLSHEDSLKIIEKSSAMHENYSQLFYTFKRDGSLVAGSLVNQQNTLEFKKIAGGFQTDGNRILITLPAVDSDYAHSETYLFTLTKSTLTLMKMHSNGYTDHLLFTYRKTR